MPIFVSCNQGLFFTCYKKMKMDGIMREAARKRIKCYFIHSRAELLSYEKEFLAEPSSLVLIPGTLEEVYSLQEEYKGLPLHVIVFGHHAQGVFDDSFSYIMSDQPGAMKKAISHLRERGCKRLALFGVSSKSNHDYCRIENFTRYSGCPDAPVFFLESSNEIFTCAKKLLAFREPIDGLLCGNDFVALRLMSVLSILDPDWNRKMLLLGFSDTQLGSLHSPSLTSLSLGYVEGGKQIVNLHRTIVQDPQVAYMHFLMHSHIRMRDTTAAESPAGICFADLPTPSDAELSAQIARGELLMRLENLLFSADATERQLLLGIVRGKTQRELAEDLFLSDDSVKYRIRKLKTYFGLPSSAKLAEFLQYWLDARKLASETAPDSKTPIF